MLNSLKITIIGPGVMGQAILSSLIASKKFDKAGLRISGPQKEQIDQLVSKFEVGGFVDNAESVQDADVIILAIKPQRFEQAAKSIRGKIKKDSLIISIVAGLSMQTITEKLDVPNVIRAMPNTPAQIGKGITVWVQMPEVSESQSAVGRIILSNLGEEVFVEDESYLDMATALSGTGPAYVFLFMEAMIDAGVHLGFPRRIAEKLVVQTIRGSAEFYMQNQEHPARLRNEVTSPGGTSAEALYYLEKAGFRTAISRAIWAAYERSIDLGRGNTRKDVNKQMDK